MGRVAIGNSNDCARGAGTAFRAGTSIIAVLSLSAALWLMLCGSANAASVTYYGNAQSGTSVGVKGTTNMSPLNDLSVTLGTSNNYRLWAATTAPSGNTRYRIREASGNSWTRTDQEMYSFYTAAYTDANRSIGANVSVHADLYMNSTGGTSASAKAVLYEYNDVTGIVGAAKGTATYSLNVGISSLQTMNANFGNSAFTVASGNRLLVIFSLSASNARPAYLWGQASGTSGPSGYESITVSESAAATCTANAPTVTITPPSQTITANGGSVVYSMTVRNNDTAACSSTTFTLAPSDGNTTNFNASTLGSSSVALAPGATSAAITLTVSAKAGQTSGTDTTTVTASAAGHANGTGTATTTLNVCTANAPTVTITPASQTISTAGGSAAYTVTVRNNDTAACSSTTFTLAPSDGNTTNFNASTLGSSSVALAPGATSAAITLTVSAKAGQTSGTDATTVTASAPGHSTGTSSSVTTTLNASSNGTTAGTATAQPGDDTLLITALYTGDVNGNNTLRIEWGLCPGGTCDGTTFTDAKTLAHAASPYSYGLTGLTNGTKYQVRVTCQDADGVAGNAAQTFVNLIPRNPLLHNSLNTGSSKWASEGGWGVPGGKYGEFVCETCHTSDTANIKRIAGQITAPDTSKGNIPGSTVLFTSAKDGSSDFGDDSRSDKTKSTNICEVCHTYDATQTSGVRQHAYSVPVDPNHYNKSDCTACHKHNKGFLPAACNSCHGSPPITVAQLAHDPFPTGSSTPGTHDKHVNALAFTCSACHNNSVMPQESVVKPGFGDISIAFSAFGSATTGTYGGQANVSYNNRLGDGTKACSNIYCHGSTLGASVAPVWDGTAACGSCHNVSASNPPALGAHLRHAATGTYETAKRGLDIPCSDCHGAAAGAQGHVNGNVSWSLNSASVKFGPAAQYRGSLAGSTGAIAPSAAYGACSNVYCHSTVTASGGGAGTFVMSPLWNGSTTCASCHADQASNFTGSHQKHTASSSYAIACAVCHSGAGSETARHADRAVDVAFSGISLGGSYSGTAAPGDSYGRCANVYCHSSGQNETNGTTGPVSYATVTWGSGALNCGSCHKNMKTDVAATGSHVKHAQGSSIACAACHSGYTETTVAAGTHANSTVDVSFSGTAAGTLYTGGTTSGNHAAGGGYGSCSTSYCHSTVQSATGAPPATYVTATWGSGALNCGSCHKNMNSDATAPGSHVSHAQSASIGCATCHNGYTASSVNAATHANNTINVAMTVAGAFYTGGTTPGNDAPGGGYGSCATSCHGAGSPTWGSNFASDIATCVKCHGVSTTTTAQYASDPKTAAPGYVVTGPTRTGVDTAGQTGTPASFVSSDNQVGAHDVHLRALNNYAAPAQCGDCHAVTELNSAGHMNGTATMVWSSLSSSGGGLTPGYLNGACSNVYCHGGAFAASVKGVATAPTWTNGNYLAGTGKAGADCNQCHQSPPLSSAKFDHSGYTLASDCAGCHNHNGTGAAHINGLLEASGSCNGCHAYPPYPGDGMTKPADVSPEGKGAHVKHVSHLEARWLVSHPGDPLNASTDSFGSAKFQFICGACHNGATHRMTSTTAADRTIAIDPKYLFSSGTPTYNGRPGTTSASYPKTCSNVSCHFTASPGWQNPAVPE